MTGLYAADSAATFVSLSLLGSVQAFIVGQDGKLSLVLACHHLALNLKQASRKTEETDRVVIGVESQQTFLNCSNTLEGPKLKIAGPKSAALYIRPTLTLA